MSKTVSRSVLAWLFLAATLSTAAAEAAQPPQIVKQGTLGLDLCESTPFVFREHLYRLEWFRNGSILRVMDHETQREVSRFGAKHRFPCAFVEGGTVYVVGTKETHGWYGDTLTLFRSQDLTNWTERVLFHQEGLGICNTSLCRDGQGYVMSIEMTSPGGFPARFLESKDLVNWQLKPEECRHALGRYNAAHCLRWQDGWYYLFYLEAGKPHGYEQYVTRSRDLVRWEPSLLNPVLAASDGDHLVRNPLLTAEERAAIAANADSNNSDIDFCEYQGRLVINYCWGTQGGPGHEYLAEASFAGTEREFLAGWFPSNAGAPQPGDADYPTPSPSERHDQKVAAVKNGDYDLVLIGDSITHTLGELGGKYEPLRAVWDRHFAPRRAINLGHNGYRTENILWNLQNGELEFNRSPKLFLVLLGTNNTDDRHFPRTHTPEQILDGMRAIVNAIRGRHPTSKILLLRIFPRGGDGEKSISPPDFHSSERCIESCRKAGALTAQLADGKQVFWLDVNHVFLRADGTINSELLWDLLHPGPAGAEAWAQAIEPTLAELLGDQPIVDPPRFALLQPATSSGDGTYDWRKRHESALQAKALKPRVVFIGDSITHHFGGLPPEGLPPAGQPVWDRLFPASKPAINLGFGADRVEQVLWRLDHGELDGLEPARVVLMIGANHVLAGQDAPEAVVAGVRACLQRIRAKTPRASILLLGVLPCRNPADHPDRQKVRVLNDGLAQLAREAKVDYLDMGPRFLDASGNIPTRLMGDAVHPTREGYEIWAEAMTPFLP